MASAVGIQVFVDEHYAKCVVALQKIALLADTHSALHKERFANGRPAGWRVAEAMREIANDAVGGFSLPESLRSDCNVQAT